jgi:hypothetical protein
MYRQGAKRLLVNNVLSKCEEVKCSSNSKYSTAERITDCVNQ